MITLLGTLNLIYLQIKIYWLRFLQVPFLKALNFLLCTHTFFHFKKKKELKNSNKKFYNFNIKWINIVVELKFLIFAAETLNTKNTASGPSLNKLHQ